MNLARRPAWALLALLGLVLACPAWAQSGGDSDLPQTLRRDYVAPVVGPAQDSAYARGQLGLVRNSFGRASLYVAWRVMQLPVGALANESHDRQADWVRRGPQVSRQDDQIQAWLALRGQSVPQAPAVTPDYFRTSQLGGSGFEVSVGQCGPDAFDLATRTLADLRADKALSDADRRAWVVAQDAVFARCTWTPGSRPAPALPPPPSARSAERLKALHAYQHAAALFYGDEYSAARDAFDAMARQPDHPMKAWAALGALRAVVREIVRDSTWAAAVDDAWVRRGLRDAAFSAAVAGPAAQRRARVAAAMKDIDARAQVVLADNSLSGVHEAVRYTVRRAIWQVAPEIPLREALAAMDNPNINPYSRSTLDLVQELYPRLVPDRPEGAMGTALRRYTWLDFVVTVQGCPDLPAQRTSAVCQGEHAHAVARWQETRHNAWLLAALMTATEATASDLALAQAAQVVNADRPEWTSLQFHASRVLGKLGRSAEARAALEAVVAARTVHRRDRPLLDAELRKY